MEEKEKREIPGFMRETIKQKPVNKRKLLRKTVVTICLAILFGMVASFTILVLEPTLNTWLYPEETPNLVIFPEEQDEIKPEDMIYADDIIINQNDNGTEIDELAKMFEAYQLDKDNYIQMSAALKGYVSEISKSMVTVTGITSDVDWFNNSYELKGQNYGVIIADNGIEFLILTCRDDLEIATEIEVTFSTAYKAMATIKKVDQTLDIAIVAVEKEGLPEYVVNTLTIASFGTSSIDAKIGTPVVAMGSPLGYVDSIGYGTIVTEPIAQNMIDANYKLYTTDIYGSTTAKGVLFNLQGQIIGVVGVGSENSDIKNLISCIGISELKAMISLLSNDKEIPYFGVYGVSVPSNIHEEKGIPYGAYINQIELNSPAMYEGIQNGDIITKFAGEEIVSYDDYVKVLLKQEPGASIDVTVSRMVQEVYKSIKMTVTLQ